MNYFLGWTKWQRRIIIGLLVGSLVVHLLPLISPSPPSPQLDPVLHQQIKNLFNAPTIATAQNTTALSSQPPQAQRYNFNPNTLTTEEWIGLGVSPRTAATIHNYLSKGGHFYHKKDLAKIYGLPHHLYLELEPYIIIPARSLHQPTSVPSQHLQLHSPKNAAQHFIDINTDSQEEWESLKGIGEKLSQRILNYKTLLGGFYNTEQLKEVFGINDSLFNNIKNNLFCTNNPPLKKIDLNTCDFKTLARHPYTKYENAKLILSYRTTHGEFQNINQIADIKAITKAVFEKMKPYLFISPPSTK